MKCYCAVLTFEPQNSTTSGVSQGHPLHQVWTLWDHSFLSYAVDKQTARQTDSKILPTPTDIVSMDNKYNSLQYFGDELHDFN